MIRKAGSSSWLSIRLSWRGLLGAAVFLACAGALASFFGRLTWWLELATHFRVQYTALFLIFSLVLLISRQRRYALVFLVLAMVQGSFLIPLYRPVDRPASQETVKALVANVNTKLGDPERVMEMITAENPDFFILQEVDKGWLDALSDLEERYPFTTLCPRGDNFGIAIYSRLPWVSSEAVYLDLAMVPSTLTEFKINQHPVTVIGTHTIPPGNKACSLTRNYQLDMLASNVHQVAHDVLVLGDLNTTSFSPYFNDLLRTSGLRDSQLGFGYQPTWPAFLWPILIPLDHALYSDGLVIHERRIGAATGSDHYPLIIEFSTAEHGQTR